jgi:GT2 family glycosyltransferase
MKTSIDPLVSIITVNFNSTQVTLELLESLKKLTYSSFEVIVIDNGSQDNPEKTLQEAWPSIIFKRSEVNLGFAGGNNLGIALAKGDYLFFINNDTEVTPNLVTELIQVLKSNPAIGLLSPKICYFSSKLIQFAGYTPMHAVTARNQAIGNKHANNETFSGVHSTPYAHGAAMMTTRAVIDKVGPMPTEFFLYYEELDWCESIKRAGYTIAVSLSSVIYHKESMSVGKTSPLKLFYQTRNRILFVRRNFSALNSTLFHVYFFLLVSPVKLFKFLLKKEWAYAKAYWRALGMAETYTK